MIPSAKLHYMNSIVLIIKGNCILVENFKHIINIHGKKTTVFIQN